MEVGGEITVTVAVAFDAFEVPVAGPQYSYVADIPVSFLHMLGPVAFALKVMSAHYRVIC